MSAARHTATLAGVVAIVAVVDVAAHVLAREAPAPVLPSTPRFDAALAASIRLGGGESDARLVRGPSGWTLGDGGPSADPIEVEALLTSLAAGIRPDQRVDDAVADHERYGLAGGDERWVEVRGAGGDALSAFAVGDDAGGGATWIRLPDTPDVYRARIGGRARYVRPAGAWRDRRVVDVDPAAVVGVTIVRAEGGAPALDVVRAGTEGWAGDVDDPTVDRVVAELAHLRGAEILDSGLVVDAPGPEVTLALAAGGPVRLRFARRAGGWSVTRADTDTVWRIAADWPGSIDAPGVYRDRALWTLPGVTALDVAGPGLDGTLAQRDGAWVVTRPANVDVDPARALAAVRFLAAPRVARWAESPPADAGFPSVHRWRVTSTDGASVALELGRADGDVVWVRRVDRPEVTGQLDARAVAGVESLFGGG